MTMGVLAQIDLIFEENVFGYIWVYFVEIHIELYLNKEQNKTLIKIIFRV